MRDLGLLVLRLIVGGLFVVHGYPKVFGGAGKSAKVPPALGRYLGANFTTAVEQGGLASFRANVERTGVPQPRVMAPVAAFTELLGGALLVLGLLSRPAALLLCGQMGVAVARVHWKNGLYGQGGYEFPLTLLGACLALVLTGPGALSIDGDRGGQ